MSHPKINSSNLLPFVVYLSGIKQLPDGLFFPTPADQRKEFCEQTLRSLWNLFFSLGLDH